MFPFSRHRPFELKLVVQMIHLRALSFIQYIPCRIRTGNRAEVFISKLHGRNYFSIVPIMLCTNCATTGGQGMVLVPPFPKSPPMPCPRQVDFSTITRTKSDRVHALSVHVMGLTPIPQILYNLHSRKTTRTAFLESKVLSSTKCRQAIFIKI